MHGRSGFTPAGNLAPLTDATLWYFQQNTGITLSSAEVDSLIDLDMALLNDEMERAKAKSDREKQSSSTAEPDHG